MDGLQWKLKLLRLSLHGPQEQAQLALVRLFIHHSGNVLNERSAAVKRQAKVVFKNLLEILVEGIDVINNRLEDAMSNGLLQDIQSSWNIEGVSNGKLGVCSMKCGKEFDPFAEQFK